MPVWLILTCVITVVVAAACLLFVILYPDRH